MLAPNGPHKKTYLRWVPSPLLSRAIAMNANIIKWGLHTGVRKGGNFMGQLPGHHRPHSAMIIQMSISRSREYQADASGAQFAGSAGGLANALLKLENAARRVPMQVNPATSHLFIVNPLSGASVARLFSTHPPIEERVKRLSNMKIYVS